MQGDPGAERGNVWCCVWGLLPCPHAASPALPAGPQAQALGLVLVLLSFPAGATSLVSMHLLLRKTRCHWVSQPRMGQHRS